MGKTDKVNSRSQYLTLILVLIGGIFTSYSQCPTVTNPLQTYCDLETPTVASLTATPNGNGVRWYATATSTTPLSNSQGLINGEDYYADNNSGTCGTRPRVDVVIYSAPTGLSFQGVCVDSPNDATIADLIANGNDIKWYTVANGGTALAPSTILMDNTLYYVNQSNPYTGCRTSRLTVFVNVGVVPVPVGDAIQEFCAEEQPTVADLQASGTNNWYLTFSSASPLESTTPLVDGQTYFATTVDPPCESDERLEVTVVLSPPNNSGSNGSINLCETDLTTTTSVNLFPALGGSPNPSGIWTGTLPTSNGNLGTVDVTTLTVAGGPYVFTYSVSTSPCGVSTSTVTITIIPPPNAGTDGILDVCETDAPQDLFNSLGGTPENGGSWSPALASDTGLFDPAVDTSGIYTYTVAGTAPCDDASATVTVTINPKPDAGTNGSLDICETDVTLQDLSDSLGGTPDTGGTWSPALASGTGIFNPAIDSFGIYTYTVTGTPPCGDVSATVMVTLIPLPNPGTDGTLDFCENDPAQDLFNSLGGTPDTGGTWSPALASGTGVFDPTIDTAGTYNYTVAGTVPCADASATVTVTINAKPDAGSNGSLNLCEIDLTLRDLFDSLGGTPDTGGTWSPALASGTGIFNIAIDSPGTYTYTVAGTPPCGDDFATVTVTLIPLPNAGTNGTLEVCENDAPQDLFNSLGGTPDAGGSWSPALASGTGVFDPSVDTAGSYTYTVTGTVPCGDATATVTVTINPKPDAGTAGSLNLCESDTTLQDLFDSLGGTPDIGGTWSPVLASGTGIFDPALDAAGVYTYTVTGIPPCGDASATVTVVLVPIPDAGTDGIVLLCENDAPQDLFNSLGGTPDAGGIWSPVLASGTGVFDPSVDTAGRYTYTVTGTAPCGDASATVTVTINPKPDAGTSGTLATCLDAAPQDLFDSLGGTPDVGGIWSPALASGTGVFDPAVDAAVTYTYTVAGIAPCGDASTTVTVTIKPTPNAGTDGTLSICSNISPVNLFDSLGGTPDAGGIWSPALSSGTGVFDPSVDTSGTYTYTLSGDGFCGEDASTVTVDVSPAPNITGLTITVASVCLNESSEVVISGATQLTDGQYSFTYTLFGANSSQTTVVLLIVNGAASFDIPAYLLSNPGSTIFTLADLTSDTTGCNVNVEPISTVNFEVIQDPTPELVANGNSFCLEDMPTIADITANLVGTNPVVWYDALEDGNPYVDTDLLVDGTTYYASNIIEAGCNNGIRLAVTVSIETCAELDLLIPDGFSPNDDSINDQFVIKNLRDLYPNFNLQIYNRYGNILYVGDTNTPDWNGTSDTGRELGNATLPVGVYFFILDLKDNNNRTIQGRVYLSR